MAAPPTRLPWGRPFRPRSRALLVPRTLWARPGMWDTQGWPGRLTVPRGRGEPEETSLLGHETSSLGTARRGLWGAVQRPSQAGGLGWATGLRGRQPAPGSGALLCALPPAAARANTEQGAAVPERLGHPALPGTWRPSFSKAHTSLECQSLLLPAEHSVSFYREFHRPLRT